MQATKMPLTSWFPAWFLIGQAKTGISSLELSRHLGVNVDTAWLLHGKVLRAMAFREFRLKRRFTLAAMNERIANALCCWMSCIELDLWVAEAYG
jgi:hypothetical protein